MGRKYKKKHAQARKNTNKQKRNSTKKKAPASTPHAAADPNIAEKGGAEGKKGVTEISTVTTKASSSASTKNGNGEERWGVMGLANLRNTCYFNSVLQLLLSSACLKNCFSRDDLKQVMMPSSLTAAMCELFDLTLRIGEKRFQFKPNRALTAIRMAEPLFKSKGQHDAHELLLTLLRHLVEEAERYREGDLNWMDEIFGGKLTSKITCKKCGYIKSREEDFLVLSISVLRDDIPCSAADAAPTSHAPSRESVLPDVVERNDPDALAHLQPTPDQSSVQNNCVDDSASEPVQNEEESTTNDDMWSALHDLFANVEEEEEERSQSDTSSNLLDSVTSLYDKEHPETVNNEVFPGRGRRKSKKKERKKANRFEDLDFDVEESETVSDARRFQTLEECLDHFFSHESVTWRCAGEFPEKRVSFSDQPEIFVLPSSRESKSGNWKYYPSDDENEDSADKDEDEATGETSDATTESASVTAQKECDLKPCLKKKSREPLPPIPPLNSIKQYFVWKAPKVLCIHLKRFEVLGQRRISKLAHAVKFETKINVDAFVDPNSPSTSTVEYELKAVVCHSGSLSFGHYTAFVSRTVNGEQQWYDVSDSDVQKASLSKVLKSQAYILLYEASGDTQTCLSESS